MHLALSETDESTRSKGSKLTLRFRFIHEPLIILASAVRELELWHRQKDVRRRKHDLAIVCLCETNLQRVHRPHKQSFFVPRNFTQLQVKKIRVVKLGRK